MVGSGQLNLMIKEDWVQGTTIVEDHIWLRLAVNEKT